MRMVKTIFTLVVMLLCSAVLYAQTGTEKSAVGETMRSSGRIYVVVAVMLVILTGLILYVVRLDRKITKLEKE